MTEPTPVPIKVTCEVCGGRLLLAAAWYHEVTPEDQHEPVVKVG